MTEDDFMAIKTWVKTEAKLIAADIAGHHPNTISKHREKVVSAERGARRALQVAE